MPHRTKTKNKRNKQRKTFRQLCSLNTLSLLKVFKFKLSFDFNLTEHNIYHIMRNATCTFLLFAFGVANATEDQVTDGKHIHP